MTGAWESQLRLAERARRQAEASLSSATRARADLVRDARARGTSWGAIAAVLGCSRTRVVQIAGDVSAEPVVIRPLPDPEPAGEPTEEPQLAWVPTVRAPVRVRCPACGMLAPAGRARCPNCDQRLTS